MAFGCVLCCGDTPNRRLSNLPTVACEIWSNVSCSAAISPEWSDAHCRCRRHLACQTRHVVQTPPDIVVGAALCCRGRYGEGRQTMFVDNGRSVAPLHRIKHRPLISAASVSSCPIQCGLIPGCCACCSFHSCGGAQHTTRPCQSRRTCNGVCTCVVSHQEHLPPAYWHSARNKHAG